MSCRRRVDQRRVLRHGLRVEIRRVRYHLSHDLLVTGSARLDKQAFIKISYQSIVGVQFTTVLTSMSGVHSASPMKSPD